MGNSRPGKRRDHRKGNGQHGILERAAPLIAPRGRLKERERLTAATEAETGYLTSSRTKTGIIWRYDRH